MSRSKSNKPGLSRCPTCGRAGLKRRAIEVPTPDGGPVVPGVVVEVCPHCGEELYDAAAMRKLEAARPRRRPRRPLAAEG